MKDNLRKGFPVILRIGNGYTKNGGFNILKALILGHWISIWGFSDSKKVFYIYDSAAPAAQLKNDIPIGNVIRPYEDVLRDWKLGGRLGFGIGKYKYICVWR